MAFDYERFNRRYGPWVSLALGVVTVAFVRRGVRYAPVALATLMVAWGLAWFLGRRQPVPAVTGAAEPGDPAVPPSPAPADVPGRIRRLLPSAAVTAAVGLYQNVLFYLVPVWAASATWPSSNMLFPILLAAMALFSCFEYPYRAFVLQRALGLGLFSGVTLFAALVPAVTVLGEVPLRYSLVGSAALAGMAAGWTVVRARGIGWRHGLPGFLGAIGLAMGLMTAAGPYLPPVPVQCAGSGSGTAVDARELVGPSDRFEPGVPRVYAWFRVSAPARWKQPVRFQWYRDGQPTGGPLDEEVVGGREAGFRTWTYRKSPGPGDWRVDLVADSGQLVGRVRFVVARGTD